MAIYPIALPIAPLVMEIEIKVWISLLRALQLTNLQQLDLAHLLVQGQSDLKLEEVYWEVWLGRNFCRFFDVQPDSSFT